MLTHVIFQILTTDKLSTLICTNCVKTVNQWHTYKESCLRSQNKLQEWLASHSQSKPMVSKFDGSKFRIFFKLFLSFMCF